MKRPSESDLLGYLLGALDAREQEQVQKAIDCEPGLEDQLLTLKASLAPLELIDRPLGPPPGLARRTCQMISVASREFSQLGPPRSDGLGSEPAGSEALGSESKGYGSLPGQGVGGPVRTAFETVLVAAAAREAASGLGTDGLGREMIGQENVWSEAVSDSRPTASRFPATDEEQPRLGWARSRFSFADFVVAITAATCMGAVIFPLLLMSRFEQRLVGCQNNLSTAYRSLATYAESHDGKFIWVPREGKLSTVGSFAPIMKSVGLIPDDSMLTCPGIDSKREAPFRIPTCEQINSTECPKRLCDLYRIQAGDYGYSMGNMRGDDYFGPCDFGRPNMVLMADAPSCSSPGRASLNHSGRGQNCLMESGEIRFLPEPVCGDDPIYTNEFNVVGPGVNDNDSVIGASQVPLVIVGVQPHRTSR